MSGAVLADGNDVFGIGGPNDIPRLEVGQRVDEAEGLLQLGYRTMAAVVVTDSVPLSGIDAVRRIRMTLYPTLFLAAGRTATPQ
jgi:hypothetical protein